MRLARATTGAFALALALAGCSIGPIAVHPPAPVARATPSPVPSLKPPVELPTSSWLLSNPGYDTEGYASATSAAPGDTVTLYVSSHAGSWWADVYRMGWYGGLGGALIESLSPRRGVDQGDHPKIDPATGLVRAAWSPSAQLPIPLNWPSGMYMIKLSDSTGKQSYIPLVVRGDGLAPMVFVHSVATDEAYNLWGGTSLYSGTTPALHLPRAVEVTFDRPFNQDYGAGDFFYWEYQMVRFLERTGIQVDYLSDVDVQEHPGWLLGYRAVLLTGHDEYWSRDMRDAYLNAVGSGVSLAVFGANTAYRPIRYLDSPVGPDRIVVCYKDAALDPQHDTPLSWRAPPLNWDESRLLGIHYVGTGNIRQLPWVVSDPSSWVFKGSGVKAGTELPGLLGYEQDQFSASAPHPAGVDVLTRSPVTALSGQVVQSNASVYQAGSGATVFDTGSIQWSWGLDDFKTPALVPGLRQTFVTDRRPDYASRAAQVIASNVFRRMLGDRYPKSAPSPPATPPPAPPSLAPTEPPATLPPDEG